MAGPLPNFKVGDFLNKKEILDIFFWQTLGAVIQAMLAPEIAALEQESFKLTPTLILGAAQLADSVVRGHLDLKTAQDQARQGGLTEDNFQLLVDGAGQPLPLTSLLEAMRRGIIPQKGTGATSTSLEQGIRESDVKDKWTPVVEALQWLLPDPGTVVEARLRGYINDADFNDWMAKIGYDPTVRGFIFKAAGVPISPQEGYAAFHRGLIPKDASSPDTPSLAQIFRESRINDKYLETWMALQVYIPPPRTTTALLRAGSITEAKAREWFKDAGLQPDAVDAYVADASNQKTQGSKDLAKADILAFYAAGEITAAQAHDALAALGYDDASIGFELSYQDFKLVKAQVDALVSRIRTLYTGHKISKQTAVDALGNVGMASEVISKALTVWDQEANANPVLLTAVQIADAAALGALDPKAAFDELQGRGYDARDAYLVLKLHKVDVSGVPAPEGVIVGP